MVVDLMQNFRPARVSPPLRKGGGGGQVARDDPLTSIKA
jgi:hypothetical protein